MDRTTAPCAFSSTPCVRRILGGLLLLVLLSLSFSVWASAEGELSLPLSSYDENGVQTESWIVAAPDSASQPSTAELSSFESDVIALVNQERALRGLYPLVANASLTLAARGHSQAMSTYNFFNHVSLDGSTFVQRIELAGYTGLCSAGENIAAGQTSPADVVRAWMSSTGHRANILSTSFRDIGVGYVYEPNDTYPGGIGYKHYWTQDFGSRDCWGPTPTPQSTATRTNTPVNTPTWTPSRTNTPVNTPTWTPTRTSTPASAPARTSTPTWTPTQTTALLSATLVGAVDLQGRPPKPHICWCVPLSVTLLREDGSAYRTVDLSTNPYGEFTLSGIAPGTYGIRVKHRLTLANYKSEITLLPNANRVELGTLLAGDSSNDNMVDVVDFSLLRANFGSASNLADYNGDGAVDVIDFSLLRTHFGLVGDIPVE